MEGVPTVPDDPSGARPPHPAGRSHAAVGESEMVGPLLLSWRDPASPAVPPSPAANRQPRHDSADMKVAGSLEVSGLKPPSKASLLPCAVNSTGENQVNFFCDSNFSPHISVYFSTFSEHLLQRKLGLL